MSFILRLYFVGLMAFVPSNEGDEATVLVLDARAQSALTAHAAIESHEPLLLARGRCSGDCGAKQLALIAKKTAPHFGENEGIERLQSALQDGGAWMLSDTELVIRQVHSRSRVDPVPGLTITGQQPAGTRSTMPTLEFSRDHLENFGFVTNLNRLMNEPATVDSTLLSEGVLDPRIVARLRLTDGKLRTRTVHQIGDEIVPIEFRSEHQKEKFSAVADSAMLELEVEGTFIEIEARDPASGCTRRMRLAPAKPGGTVEVALLNSPVSSYNPNKVLERSKESPTPGHHFALYYLLTENPPPDDDRPIPHLGMGERIENPSPTADPRSHSELLEAIGLTVSRGQYDRIICPLAQIGEQ